MSRVLTSQALIALKTALALATLSSLTAVPCTPDPEDPPGLIPGLIPNIFLAIHLATGEW